MVAWHGMGLLAVGLLLGTSRAPGWFPTVLGTVGRIDVAFNTARAQALQRMKLQGIKLQGTV